MHFIMFCASSLDCWAGANRCLARLDEESAGGLDRFLSSAIMLDPPGQRLKLPDGPSVQLRRASEHCFGNREILEGISKIVNTNASRFFRGC